VIGESPGDARPRPDLSWLRHRTLRRPPVAAPPAGPGASPVGEFLSGHAPRPGRGTNDLPAPPPVASSLDLSAPAAEPASRSSLDLSSPLDLSDPLDLTPAPVTPPPGAPAEAAAPDRRTVGLPPTAGAPSGAQAPRRPAPRVASGARLILTQRDPTVTLNRVQSGVGTLVIEAISSPAVGDVRIGALYQLADGGVSGIVQLATGIAAAPAQSRRPVILASGGQYDRLTVDLRQSQALSRMLVYAFSESGRELDWGGTLRLTTLGGSRVEFALDLGRHQGPIALLSVYRIDGEFVLRAEAERVSGATRDVAQTFGYSEISWADDRTPVL
jgi:hypothetical protein